MPCTYILYSQKLDKYYIGSCINMDIRLRQHNSGVSKFTRVGIPWIVAYAEEYTLLSDARRRELQIKRMKSRKYIEDLIQKGRASRF
jgi:putative endonuclease